MTAALPYVTYEDPYETAEDAFDLPHVYIMRVDQVKDYLSGGLQPRLFPGNSNFALLLKFWPDATYHDAGDESNEWIKAQDIAGLIVDELTGSLNGADITVDATAVALPSVMASTCLTYDSREDGIQRVTDAINEREYRYYYQTFIGLEVRP